MICLFKFKFCLVLDGGPSTTRWKRTSVTLGTNEASNIILAIIIFPKINYYCSSFNFKGGDQQKKVGLLSGGERNRVHMARLLKEGGNVLLLDEPTNDLDVETLRALEDALVDFAGCGVVISHDRFFLDRICTHILAFEGEAHVEWFEGNFEDYEEDKKRRLGADALEPKRIKHKKFMR